jgi:NADH:ubiquinone oxidoreductase subunit 5 (subunit L)/multisubunit Na+/H+ antiporter MnhA subunit
MQLVRIVRVVFSLAFLTPFIDKRLGKISGYLYAILPAFLFVLLQDGAVVKGSKMYMPLVLLILAGAFTKSAQFPFHFWLPGAMEAPTPVSAYLHSATMVKAGIYLLARLHPILGGTDLWQFSLGLAGAMTMLVGAYFAFTQFDLKKILAYRTTDELENRINYDEKNDKNLI